MLMQVIAQVCLRMIAQVSLDAEVLAVRAVFEAFVQIPRPADQRVHAAIMRSVR